MTEITRERVLALIDAYGSDPVRWPDAEREGAIALLSGDPDLARAAEEARTLDFALDTLPAPFPNPALRVALKEIPESHGGLLEMIASWFGVWRPAAGLAAAAVLGIALGVANPDLPLPGFVTQTTTDQTAEIDTDSYSLAAATAAGIATQDTF